MNILKPVEKTTKKIMNILNGLDEVDDPAGYRETNNLITTDRQHIAQVLCDLLEGEIWDLSNHSHLPPAAHHDAQIRNATLRTAQSLIRQTLDPISN